MTYKLGLICVLGVATFGCEDERYDATERAVAGAFGTLRQADATVERATGFSFFGRIRSRLADASPYQDGRWVIPIPEGSVAFAFADSTGTPLMFPDDDTDGMEIEVTQQADAAALFDLPGDHTAFERSGSSTSGLTTGAPSIVGFYGLDHHHDLDGVVLSIGGEVSLEVDFAGRCPAGTLSGSVTATGRTPLQLEGSREVEVSATYDGRELSWEILDGDRVLEEGVWPSAASEHC